MSNDNIRMMARELSEALIEQQKFALYTRPFVVARITKKWGNVIRYDYSTLYEENVPSPCYTATMPGDGSLIRLRFQYPQATVGIYYQRITNPGEDSDFSAWTRLNGDIPLAMASCSSGAKVAQFYIRSDRQIKFRESSDNGATWGNWALIGYTASTTVKDATATYTPNGDLILFYTEQLYLRFMKREAGIWGAAVTSPNQMEGMTGITVCYNEDYNIAVTYGTSDPAGSMLRGVATCIMGDGGRVAAGTWSPWNKIIERGATEQYNYRAPSLQYTDTTRLYFIEDFLQDEQTDHLFYTHQPPSAHFDQNAWLEPVPLKTEESGFIEFTQSGDYAWLTTADQVLRAPSTEDSLILTQRLLVVDSRDYPDIFKGSLKVIIDNTGGWYNEFNRLGQQLEVGVGYYTAAGPQYSLLPYRWITKFKLVSPSWYPLRMIFPMGVTGTLRIETEDAWTFLYRYRVRRQLSWAEGTATIKEMLQYLIARAGLDFDVISESDAIKSFKPAFTITVGTSYRTAIKNLLKMVPDQLVFREGKVLLRNPKSEEEEARLILRPSGQGSETNIPSQTPASGYHWDKVDDEITDEAATTVYTTNTTAYRDLYALPNPTRKGNILKVEVTARVKNNTSPYSMGASTSIRTHDTTYDGVEFTTYDTRWINLTTTYVKNPNTSEDWTWDEIDALEAGVKLRIIDAGTTAYCTKVFVTITTDATTEPDWVYDTRLGNANLIYSGDYGQTAQNPNRVEVWSDTFMKMRANWSQVEKMRDRLSRVTTPTYANIDEAERRALAELRKAEVFTGGESSMITPVNCGLEPWDVVEITDTNAGVYWAKRRVKRIKNYWDAKTWTYQQIVTLGAE